MIGFIKLNGEGEHYIQPWAIVAMDRTEDHKTNVWVQFPDQSTKQLVVRETPEQIIDLRLQCEKEQRIHQAHVDFDHNNFVQSFYQDMPDAGINASPIPKPTVDEANQRLRQFVYSREQLVADEQELQEQCAKLTERMERGVDDTKLQRLLQSQLTNTEGCLSIVRERIYLMDDEGIA